jgi:hypothetical protein
MKKAFLPICLVLMALLQGCQTTATPSESTVVEKLKRTVVPGLDFYGAYLEPITEYLNAALREYDPEHNSQGIIFLLDPTLREGQLAAHQSAGSKVIGQGMARNITLFQALQEICAIGDLEFAISGKTVLLKPRQTNGKHPVAD